MIKVLAIVLVGSLLGQAEVSHKRTSTRAVLASKMDPDFWPARGRRSQSVPAPHKLRSDRGLNSDEDGPFWANRGRGLDEDWENEVLPERSAEKEDEPFWANRGRALGSGEDDPFWANRGRRQNEEEDDDSDTRWRKHRLYVEEPGWIWLSRREAQLPVDVSFTRGIGESYDPFWVARGKRRAKQKREAQCGGNGKDRCWSFNDKRISRDFLRELSNTKQEDFWPMRGRRAEQLTRALDLAKEDPFWPARGKKERQSPPPQ